MNRILEIACFDAGSVLIAANTGADRIELCENYNAGGLTPSRQLILEARKITPLPIHVIIRPHAHNFIYSPADIEEMKAAVLFCKAMNIDGIVFGILDAKNEIDLDACSDLISLARPISVTFHRAIDRSNDIKRSVQQLIDLGVERVLTSGTASSAEAGIQKLKILQSFYGDNIVIMPGGGIRSTNLETILRSGCREFHSSAITGTHKTADGNEIRLMKEKILVKAREI